MRAFTGILRPMETIREKASAQGHVSQSVEALNLKRLLLECGNVVVLAVLSGRVGYLDSFTGRYSRWVWLREDRVAAIRPYSGQAFLEGQPRPDFIVGHWEASTEAPVVPRSEPL